jgi:hypothetical protein
MGLKMRITGCVLTLVASSVAFADGPASASASSSPEVVYVANADSGPVTIYKAGSSGKVHPVRTIKNPSLYGTYWDPWTVTVDSSSHVYVQTFLSDATTFVFAHGSSGPPARVFQVTGPDSQSIAVDTHGYEYVMGGEAETQITVAAPHGSGNAANSYYVNPVRQFSTDQGPFAPWASTLTVDNHGEVIAAVTKASGNAIEVYQGGASGSPKRIRTISGPRTGLGSCAGFDKCDYVSIAYSAFTGRIYAAVSTSSGTHISVFAGNAHGDARPVRTISGHRTGLTGKVITGIADSQITGDIYVMVKAAQFGGPAAVEVFGRLSNGNVPALRSFTDSSSHFQDAEGIAVAG